ncbi:hypothetical protein ACFQ1S_21780 [Kibdelosporangium lantanae]|uniref:Uncharacterized protein n=1 Tax=Kibdelosporangium lantanae TaxID=1497396 RepID=A0ABW3MDC0_9PSEU
MNETMPRIRLSAAVCLAVGLVVAGLVSVFAGTAVAVTLLDGDKLVFSSEWTGAKTQETAFTRGTLFVL